MISAIHRDRVNICTKIWSSIVKGDISSRKKARKVLATEYKKNSIEPLRGRSKIDLADKELITLYLVGKYGLGLYEEYPLVFKKIFSKEIVFEEVLNKILEHPEKAEEILKETYGNKLNENIIFRIIRLCFTAIVLGFRSEDDLVKLVSILKKVFPELRKRFLSFIKFYVAFRIAERIVGGELRNRIEKEALKHSLCIKFGEEKCAPSDDFIRYIAKEVLKGEEYKINRVFKTEINVI